MRAGTTVVATARFRLREFTLNDLDDLAAMVGDREQMTFYPRPKTRDEASAWISRNLALYEELGYGFWLIECAAKSTFLGYCGIRPLELDGVAEIETGWHVKKSAWNRGIATAAAIAARAVASDGFAISRLVAVIHPEHVASRRVAEKIAMRAERSTIVDGYRALIYAGPRP